MLQVLTTFLASAWPLAWPSPQDGLGQGGAKIQRGQGSILVKKWKQKSASAQNGNLCSGNLRGPQENAFRLFRGSQLNSRRKKTNAQNFIKSPQFPVFSTLGQWLFGAFFQPSAACDSGGMHNHRAEPGTQRGCDAPNAIKCIQGDVARWNGYPPKSLFQNKKVKDNEQLDFAHMP